MRAACEIANIFPSDDSATQMKSSVAKTIRMAAPITQMTDCERKSVEFICLDGAVIWPNAGAYSKLARENVTDGYDIIDLTEEGATTADLNGIISAMLVDDPRNVNLVLACHLKCKTLYHRAFGETMMSCAVQVGDAGFLKAWMADACIATEGVAPRLDAYRESYPNMCLTAAKYSLLAGLGVSGARRLECFKIFYEYGFKLTDDVGCVAARSCIIDLLKYLHGVGFKWTLEMGVSAAFAGCKEALEFLLDTGCPCDATTCEAAAGATDTMRTLDSDEFDPVDGKVISDRKVISDGKGIARERMIADKKAIARERMMAHKKFHGKSHELLELLRRYNCAWDEGTCNAAGAAGHYLALVYAHTHGCKWTKETTAVTAANDELKCLQYEHDNGCEWDEQTPIRAAREGSLMCLHYALTHGCPCNEEAAYAAARNGKINTLVYLHAHGYAWDARTISGAIEKDDGDCFAYAYENGCPRPPGIYAAVVAVLLKGMDGGYPALIASGIPAYSPELIIPGFSTYHPGELIVDGKIILANLEADEEYNECLWYLIGKECPMD